VLDDDDQTGIVRPGENDLAGGNGIDPDPGGVSF